MNQLQMLKRALIAYVNSAKAIWSSIAHPLSIVSKRKGTLKGYRIYGNSVQEGENLFDATKITSKKYIDGTGAEVSSDTAMISDYIEVISRTVYTFKLTNLLASAARTFRINYYNAEQVWISQSSYDVKGGSTLTQNITIPSDIVYIRFSFIEGYPITMYREVSPNNHIEV